MKDESSAAKKGFEEALRSSRQWSEALLSWLSVLAGGVSSLVLTLGTREGNRIGWGVLAALLAVVLMAAATRTTWVLIRQRRKESLFEQQVQSLQIESMLYLSTLDSPGRKGDEGSPSPS